MAVSTFLFDLDGTLIDSTELILRSFRHVAETLLGADVPDATWLDGMGRPLRRQLEPYASTPGGVDRLVEAYRTFNQAHHDELVQPVRGAVALLRALEDRNARLAVVTSKGRLSAERGLEHCGLSSFFPVVVTADDVSRHKPDPEPVAHALARLGETAEAAVLIGDSPHDLAAGRAAGVVTCAALWGPFARAALEPFEPDHWLSAPSQLLELEWVKGTH